MDRPRLYSLSFVSGAVSRSTVPEIVLSFPEELISTFYAYTERVQETSHESIKKYLSNIPDLTFTYGVGDRFGYQGCARVARYRGSCEIHFELYDFSAYCVAASLSHTLVVLNTLLRDTDGVVTNPHEQQHLELYTTFGQAFFGYTAQGYIYSRFGTWLVDIGKDKSSLRKGKVVSAMNEVWSTLTHKKLKKQAAQTKLIFMNDGRFILTCFGDACDIGVYPDYVDEEVCLGTQLVRFGSHNIDTHFQQLTLIAGLAEMVGQAERDHSLMCLPMCA